MNKLKLNDEIELKPKAVRHFVRSISLLYSKPETLTFETLYASEALMFLGSFLKKATLPIGKVKGYGAWIDGSDEKFLVVNVKNKLGKAEGLIVTEKDVRKV